MSSSVPRDSSLPHHITTLPLSFPSRRRRAIGVRRVGSEAYASCTPARGRGHIRFLESVVATARWTSSSLYVQCLPISVDGPFLLLPSRQQPPVRMSTFSLLFALISFLLLALDLVNLSQIVVLVLIHISVIHVVSLFLVVGINLCIAKLLLFPTLTRLKRSVS
jgi:hypothetical protein